jgi:pilus assembly protein CpaB
MPETENTTSDTKARRLLFIAVVFALLAGVGTMLYLKVLEHRLKKELTPPPQSLETVVVASRDLPAGSIIGSATMALRKVPKKYVESDAVTPQTYDSVKGAVLNKALGQGKILSHDYIDIDLPRDFSGTISKGMRAMTIEVDTVNGLSGLIRPGNHIDLFTRLSTRSKPNQGSARGEVVIPVLENITVLATDRKSARPNIDEFHNLSSEKPPQVYSTLTLEVTARQAALVSMARSRGSLMAVLRNKKDNSKVLFAQVSSADLFNNSATMRSAAERAAETQTSAPSGYTKLKGGFLENSSGQVLTPDGKVLSGVKVDGSGNVIGPDGRVLKAADVRVDGKGRVYAVQPPSQRMKIAADGSVQAPSRPVTARSLVKVGKDGVVRTQDGKVLKGWHMKNGVLYNSRGKKASPEDVLLARQGLHKGKNGVLLDGNGKPVTARDLLKVGKDGVVRTKDGKILKGWHVGKDGTIYNAQGKKVSAEDALLADNGLTGNARGKVVTAARKLKAKDLLKVDKDGVVRTKDGKILKGWHVGKDGTIYNAQGKKATAADVLLAQKGMRPGKDGTVINADGKVLHARDLVSVGRDGVVRTRDGKVLQGVHLGKDGRLYDKNGHLVTAQDVVEREAAADTDQGTLLSGVTATPRPDQAAGSPLQQGGPGGMYEVEYILGGAGSDGAAKTIMIQVEDENEPGGRDE